MDRSLLFREEEKVFWSKRSQYDYAENGTKKQYNDFNISTNQHDNVSNFSQEQCFYGLVFVLLAQVIDITKATAHTGKTHWRGGNYALQDHLDSHGW